MAGCLYNNVVITGISCALPSKKVYTDDYIQHFGEKEIEQFKSTTGIEVRYLSNGKQTASDLCYVAARELLKQKGLSGEDIDALIFMTQYPDYKTPSTSFILHKRLGIKKECLVFDVNLGCSAFVNGLYFLSGLIQSGAVKRALLLVGDAELEHPVFDDISLTVMFGDAGTACLLESGFGKTYGIIKADGSGYDVMGIPYPGARFPNGYPGGSEDGLTKKMAGDDTFLFTITEVPKLFKEFFKQFSCSWDDFDYCMLHQANLFILNHIAKRIKLPKEKMPISINKYGNTDGASIPLGIVDLCMNPELEHKKLNLIVSGFGIGLSWGIMAFEINSEDVLPLIVTDEYFEEGFNV